MQERMEHFEQLAKAEKAKGEDGSMEKIGEYLAEAQNAAEALAPYRHPKLQATMNETIVRHACIRSPELSDTNADWIKRHVPAELRDQAQSPPQTIDGEVISSTMATASATPPASNAVELYDPSKFQLEVIQNKFFRLRRVDNPSGP
jgi:hypothetical protein